ncbi:ribbon-helix-helix domain-containing protein [Fischerella sp. PCC 9605]|uniref:ribbon-helix-helix domain-containing protein n=1 Tax=Fischerella sp. PCC 9605 TaxID=1173024 RepID=UPI00047CFB5C|nr:ribbon-helix-helix domain-containing protein [Fischerella sp. PCC 9605]
MTDRRRSEDYKQVSGYVPVELAREFKSFCAREGLSQSDALEEMLREWLAQKASNSSKSEQANRPIAIADVVRANMTKLKRCGLKNLQVLAKGEVLPTPGDFAIIASTLGIPEEEQKMIWQRTFSSLSNDVSGVKDERECSESPKPTRLEL